MAAGTADRMRGMRIALVSPYSWSYPGGVTRHIEALAEQFMVSGHHVRVLSPYDPPDRLSARMHRGARPEARELQRLHVRIAVSEAAAWTGRRFYGGSYRIIPNGVDVSPELPSLAARPPGAPLRLAFVGQAVERKGLPVLLRAFEALRDHVDVE